MQDQDRDSAAPARPEVRSRRVTVGRTRLHYRVAGEGPPLVLVHGFSASSSWWRRNITHLARRHRVYALDVVGFGRSWPKRSFSLERAAENVVAWMEAVELPGADLCGHSMGGHLCIRLAATHPERVRKLVLVGATGLPLRTRLPLLAWRSVRTSGHTRFQLAPTAMTSALQAGPLILVSALRDLLSDDVKESLARITAPTLLIWGERDLVVPLEFGQALHLGIAGSRLAVVPGAGHQLMFECAEQFNRLVLDFLDTPSASD